MLPQGDLRVVLEGFARSLMKTLTHTTMLHLYRLVIGEASRFPQLAELFYERGPRRGKERIAKFIAAAMDRGAIRRGDPLAAAQQFVALCQSGGYQRALLELSEGGSEADIEADIMLALDTFQRAWGAVDFSLTG